MNSPFEWWKTDRPSVILSDPEIRSHSNRSHAAARRMEQGRIEGRPVDLAYGRNYRSKPAKQGDKA